MYSYAYINFNFLCNKLAVHLEIIVVFDKFNKYTYACIYLYINTDIVHLMNLQNFVLTHIPIYLRLCS